MSQAQLSGAVKVQLGFESQPPPKQLFLTVFSKINGPTKIKARHLARQYVVKKCVALLFCFIPGYPRVTPYVPKMASKLTSSYLSRNFYELVCHLVVAFKIFPVVSKKTTKSF